MTANNSPNDIGKAAFPIDLERGAVPDVPNPEYTIKDIYFLLFSLPAAYLITFGLASFIDGPDLDAPDATWADPKMVRPSRPCPAKYSVGQTVRLLED